MTAQLRVICATLLLASTISGLASAASPPDPPAELPASVHSAAAKEPSTWVVAGKPGARTALLARTHQAKPLLLDGVYTTPRSRARGFAKALRRTGLFRYAEPDLRHRRAAALEVSPDGWARGAVTGGSVSLLGTAPIGIADSFLDAGHPDLAGHTFQANPGGPVTLAHGTQVASIAAGAANGSGVVGVTPGAAVVAYGMPEEFSCSDSVNAITALATQNVRVINVSYGTTEPCYAEYAAVIQAFAAGSLVVAAAGNEFREGNPAVFPAAFPHVLSVAGLNPDLSSAEFSSASMAVDVAAPGVQVPAAVPTHLDTEDGTPDGVTTVDGTSFAAPMASAVAAAVVSNRPSLSIGQVADAVRYSARDVGKNGYDTDTGYGLVDLQAALTITAPPADPLEPNDSIAEVDGTVFDGPDRHVWRGSGNRTIRASVDSVKDPVDVYRARVPGKAALKILLRPLARNQDPDLYVFESRARRLSERRTLIDRSVRGAGRTDSVLLVNRAGDARSMYVAVTVPEEAKYANADYTVQFSRRKRR